MKKFLREFKAFAMRGNVLDMAIGVTLLEAWPGGPRNTLVLFDRRGERKLTYAKVHTCDFDVERNLTPGDGFFVTELDTAAGPVQVGAMICFDREFPESARILMLQGAELILTPNACPMATAVRRCTTGSPTCPTSPVHGICACCRPGRSRGFI